MWNFERECRHLLASEICIQQWVSVLDDLQAQNPINAGITHYKIPFVDIEHKLQGQ